MDVGTTRAAYTREGGKMAKEVWKFPLPITDYPKIEMPIGAIPMHVAQQHNQNFLWALIDPENGIEERAFRLVGTGHRIEDDELFGAEYVGTFLMMDGVLVFHVWAYPGVPAAV